MNRPDPNILAELATSYVAGLADADERGQIEAWLAAGDPTTAAAVAEARAVLAALLAAEAQPVAPSAQRWRRLAADVAAVEAASRPAAPMVLRPSRPSPWPALLAAAAAAALIGGGVTYILATRDLPEQRRQTAELRQTVERQADQLAARTADDGRLDAELADRRAEVARLNGRLDEQQQRLARQQDTLARQDVELVKQRGELDARAAAVTEQQRRVEDLTRRLDQARRQLDFVTAPGVQMARITGTKEMPAIQGRAFVGAGPRGQVQLTVSQLTPAAAGRTYQFWVIPEGQGQAPVSIGVFPVGADGAARVDAVLPATNAPPKVLAISLEPAGGSASPTGPIVATGPIGG